MDIKIYLPKSVFLRDGSDYVLIPECLLPSNECERLHGPLVACGSMTIADDPAEGLWQQVVADIDQHDFALIDMDNAERLFGVGILRSRNASLSMQFMGGTTPIPERAKARIHVWKRHPANFRSKGRMILEAFGVGCRSQNWVGNCATFDIFPIRENAGMTEIDRD